MGSSQFSLLVAWLPTLSINAYIIIPYLSCLNTEHVWRQEIKQSQFQPNASVPWPTRLGAEGSRISWPRGRVEVKCFKFPHITCTGSNQGLALPRDLIPTASKPPANRAWMRALSPAAAVMQGANLDQVGTRPAAGGRLIRHHVDGWRGSRGLQPARGVGPQAQHALICGGGPAA